MICVLKFVKMFENSFYLETFYFRSAIPLEKRLELVPVWFYNKPSYHISRQVSGSVFSQKLCYL